ncbi:MAG: PD-(D/E)XK nuclease family protein [Armatimonadetes bacterium]|jgi:hypothetical protein|nr:PD-(D/E)XK nuclease family protein [Armatimonadota bacterium]
MPTPVFRHSEFEAFAACPFNYGAGLLNRVGADGLADYLCPAGREWLLDWWTQPGAPDCKALEIPEYRTQIGVQFHRFVHAYAMYCKEHGIENAWDKADLMARGFAVVDGAYSNSLRSMMTNWAQEWDYTPSEVDDAVSLTAGAFEAGLQVQYDVDGWKFVYSFHPDSAVFHAKEQRVVVEDWKSGTMGHDYDPKIPDVQLSRYAIAIRRMLGPSVETATLKKWYVNPDNPCHAESPLRWQLDLESGYLTDEIIKGPALAIHSCPEFSPSPGCWLCGFCDWAHLCPVIDKAEALIAPKVETVEQALEREAQVEKVRAVCTRAIAQCKQVKQAWVDANGPIDLGNGEEFGCRLKLSVAVKDPLGVIEQAQKMGKEIASKVKIEDPGTLLVADDPFSDEGAIDGLRVSLRKSWGVHAKGQGDDVLPVECAPANKEESNE